MQKEFCKITVEETGNPKKPFKFGVHLDGELINKLSPIYVDEVTTDKDGEETTKRVSCLKEAYDWLDTIKKNMAVQDGIFPAEKLVKYGVPDLFAKDNT